MFDNLDFQINRFKDAVSNVDPQANIRILYAKEIKIKSEVIMNMWSSLVSKS